MTIKAIWSVVIAGTLTLASGFSAAVESGTPIVETQKGQVQGTITDGIARFLGIPYAAPPVGDLRWKPPVEHSSWATIRNATDYGPICSQYALEPFSGPTTVNEDCLYLNVFTPADVIASGKTKQVKHSQATSSSDSSAQNKSERLPVMIWIHGGGNFVGMANGYDGSKLASEGRVIVVTLNYRLGVFGFLSNPALNDENHLYGNYGLLDQQFAMKWVQQNISRFGGDPENVTLFGESGGSMAIGAQLVSPMAKGLFQRVIMQSGEFHSWHGPVEQALEAGTKFAVDAGCGSGADASTAACLRAMPASKVLELNGIGSPASGAAIPLVDGSVVPLEPEKAVKTGQFNHVPILIGTNRDEYSWVLGIFGEYNSPKPALPTEQDFVNYIKTRFEGNAGPGNTLPRYPEGTVQAVLDEYPIDSYASVKEQYISAVTDGAWAVAVCGTRHFVRLMADKVPVYQYEFRDRTAPSYFKNKLMLEPLGAYHTSEYLYLFPNWSGYNSAPIALNSAQEDLSKKMVAHWTNFAWNGNPNNNGGNSPWPRYENNGNQAELLGLDIAPTGLTKISDSEFSAEHKCDFWDEVLVYEPNL
ncbi:carboxylesterase family protein [Vibrio fluvialis]|nr:carboxylesterase family protein [Vibrio fluvialis]